MKDIGLTKPAGRNNANMPKAGPKATGPYETSDGVSLEKGYNVLSDKGMSPRAVTPND